MEIMLSGEHEEYETEEVNHIIDEGRNNEYMENNEILSLKNREFSCRPEIVHEIGLWQARHNPPKYLVGYNKTNCSTRHTLVCPDKACGFNVSIQYTKRNRIGSWKIGSHPDFVEQLYHKPECSTVGKVRLRVAADILREKGETNLAGRAILEKSNELGFCLGQFGGSTAARIKKDMEDPRPLKKQSRRLKTEINLENTEVVEGDGDNVGNNIQIKNGSQTKRRRRSSDVPKIRESDEDDHVLTQEDFESLQQELAAANAELEYLREENARLRSLCMQADPQLLLEFPATTSTLHSTSLPLLPSASSYVHGEEEEGNVDTNGHLDGLARERYQPGMDHLE